MRLVTDLRSSALAAVLFFVFLSAVSAIDFRYHRYNEMSKFLRNFARTHSNLARIYSIGKSIQGRDLLVVELTAVKGSTIGVPNVKLIGNIHGNEAVGREVLLHFLEFMVDNYSTNTTISWFLNNTRLHILPSLNPDGFELASVGLCDRGMGRENANSSDLNRSFPDFFRTNRMPLQPESKAMQKWMTETPFILSASLHGGALVANYPYENRKEDAWDLALRWFNETSPEQQKSATYPLKFPHTYVSNPLENQPSVSPDDDVFQHLAMLYSNTHPQMHLGKPCSHGAQSFEGGITNGAAWYMITGGMQDYNYAFHGCMEVTLEISCCKYPKEVELRGLWEENKLPLMHYIMEAHRGVKGLIIDGTTNKAIERATLKVHGRNMNFTSSNNGEFWRLLRPGQYTLSVNATGYESRSVDFNIAYPKQNTFPNMTSLVIEMYPVGYSTTKAVAPSTDGSTEPNSNEAGNNPVPNKTVRTINSSYQDDADAEQEGLAAAVIQSNSFVVTYSLALTWMCLIAILILK